MDEYHSDIHNFSPTFACICLCVFIYRRYIFKSVPKLILHGFLNAHTRVNTHAYMQSSSCPISAFPEETISVLLSDLFAVYLYF